MLEKHIIMINASAPCLFWISNTDVMPQRDEIYEYIYW